MQLICICNLLESVPSLFPPHCNPQQALFLHHDPAMHTYTVGGRMSSQNMPLWPKNYFELKTTKQKKRKALWLFPICIKAGHKFIKVPLPSLPGRTKVNHPRQL